MQERNYKKHMRIVTIQSIINKLRLESQYYRWFAISYTSIYCTRSGTWVPY